MQSPRVQGQGFRPCYAGPLMLLFHYEFVGEDCCLIVIIIIIKGHSLRRACLQPATNTQSSKPRPPTK